jgi:hypothetical protein
MLVQRLRSFAPDVVIALGLPVSSGVASDSCGCLLSHALGAQLIDVMGVIWSGPASIPQVSCQSNSHHSLSYIISFQHPTGQLRIETSKLAASASISTGRPVLHVAHHFAVFLCDPPADYCSRPRNQTITAHQCRSRHACGYAVLCGRHDLDTAEVLLYPCGYDHRPPRCYCCCRCFSSSPYQFGSGLSAADLKTTRGYLHNLATKLILQLRPLLAATRNDPWLPARQQLGLPGATSSCPLANAVSWLKGVRRFEKCESLVDVVLGSWVLEHARGLQANQVGFALASFE